jgi:hypothetical protein
LPSGCDRSGMRDAAYVAIRKNAYGWSRSYTDVEKSSVGLVSLVERLRTERGVIMHRVLKLLVATILALGLTATAALAASAHFVGDFTITKSLTTGLSVSGKAAGLGNGPVEAFLTATSVRATYECVNKGGNVAPGQPLVTSAVTGPVSHITPRNGQITFTVTLPPPATPSSAETCPNGNWSVRLLSLTYFGVVLHVNQISDGVFLTANLGDIDP